MDLDFLLLFRCFLKSTQLPDPLRFIMITMITKPIIVEVIVSIIFNQSDIDQG